jgi:hypothetical protein
MGMEYGGGMAQQQADLGSLKDGAVVFFRSYGLSFSDGMIALLEDWEKTPSKELQASIDELESRKGIRFQDMDAFKRWMDEGD